MIERRFLSKSFLIRTGLVDLSEDQIKRNIIKENTRNIEKQVEMKELAAQGKLQNYHFVPTVILMPNRRGVNEWHVDYYEIDKIDRKRKAKKKVKTSLDLIEERQRRSINFSNTPEFGAIYTTEITVNFKENYDCSYYEEVAKELFLRYRHSMYFVTEIDNDGFFHIHIGCSGEVSEILILMHHIINKVFCRDDDSFINHLRGGVYVSDVHVNEILNENAYKKYLKKGSDGLGGIDIRFLNLN